MTLKYENTIPFPSPYGEVGFNRLYNFFKKQPMEVFPSPYGEVGFNQGIAVNIPGHVDECFRPLTGKLVLIE